MSNTAKTAEEALVSSELPGDKIKDFLEAMKQKDDEGLNKAFVLLPKDPTAGTALVSADVLRRAIENRGLNLTAEEVKGKIHYITPENKVGEPYHMNSEQFIQIVKSLEEDLITKTCGILGRKEGQKIVLYGKSGVGKTWMARKIAGRALRQRKFDVAIWLYLNRTYEGDLSLQESIAYQVSVLADFEESEAQEEAKRKEELEKDKDKDKEEESAEKMKEDIKKDNMKTKRDKIEKMIRKALEKKKLLLILDNEGSKTRLDWSHVDGKNGKKRLCLKVDSIDVGEILGMDQLESYEFLITSKNQPNGSGDIEIMVTPLTWEESKSLVTQETNGVDKSKEINDLAEFFIGKSERLPSEILIIARAVSYFGKTESGLEKLRKDKEVLEKGECLKVGDILLRGYSRLPKNVLIDCYSSETPERHFLRRGGMVNFNELISYWIMEGHLGHFNRIEDAYEEGHRVLMELIHCGLLEKQESNYVAPTGPRFDFDILDRDEFFRRVHSGLGIVYDMKLGRVALDDGMIRTVGPSNGRVALDDGMMRTVSTSNGKKMSTFIVDGNHIGEKEPARSLFEPKSELEKENLAIFNPTCQHFQLPILKMQNLRLLVLRGRPFLDSLEHPFQWTNDEENPIVPQSSPSLPPPGHNLGLPHPMKPQIKLEKLTVLEISGPSLLSEIPDNLFRDMPNLKTLNMSYLQIQFLPSSFYQLTKIEFLILRGCLKLQELDTLKKLEDLQVLDLSGSTSFEKFHDKSLHKNKELQILNLSGTKIKTLPLINSIKALKFVSLSNCTELQRIRKIDKLERLQIFDISSANEVEEFCDPSIESLGRLKILDVSGTAIRRLPSNVSNPRFLHARNCPRLRRLPPIEDFTGVEAIDLSGSCLLQEIRKEFFSKMKCLRELNLSKTKIKNLPSLPTLRRLLLSECEHFEEMENWSSLTELEYLDLSGCKALKKMKDNSFEKMIRLQYLNLSGIPLDQFPSLSKLINLKEVYVRDCPKETELLGIEKLPALEILDHSGTFLKPQLSFTNSNHCPRVLGANIDNIDYQQLLKTLGASSAGVSSGESESIDHFEKLRHCKWKISNWRPIDEDSLGSPVYGIHFLLLLNKYPSLMTKNLSHFHFLVYPRILPTDHHDLLLILSARKPRNSLRQILPHNGYPLHR